MKGILQKTGQGWVIRYDKRTWQDPSAEDGEIPLHPADVEQINKDSQVFDNIEARIVAYPEVEFMIVNKLWGVNDDIISYAKLINQVSPTYTGEYPFKKFSLIDERPSAPASDRTNIDLKKMESKLDEVLVNETSESLTKWMNSKREEDVEKVAEEEYPEPNPYVIEKEGFIKGYNKAKETLYTEQQLRFAMKYASEITNNKMKYMEDYIQSLKQPKQ